MFNINGIFGCIKVLFFVCVCVSLFIYLFLFILFFFFVGVWGYVEICRYFLGMRKFVGIFRGLKSGLRTSPCSRQRSEYPHPLEKGPF